MSDLRWIATLSDGTTAVEHSGEYTIIPGERKPWVRLARDLGEKGLYLTSLRINFRGHTTHMPRSNFDRFDLNEKSLAPLFYSLQYHLEAESANGAPLEQTMFIDAVGHYENDLAVHYICDVTNGATSWVVVTKGFNPMMPSPLRRNT